MKKQQSTHHLDPESIADVSAQVRAYLAANKTGQSICMRTGMVIEEVLLELREEFGDEASLKLTLSRKLGRPWVVLQYKGKRFNPAESSQIDPLSGQILSQLGIAPVWSYYAGVNRITFRLPSAALSPEVLLVGAVLLALLLGALGGAIPEAARSFMNAYILSPVSNVFMNLLSTLAPMLVFLSIMTSVAGSGGGETGNATRYVIVRYVLATVAVGLVSALALIPFFRFHFGSATAGSFSFDALFQMILDIVPANLIRPFSDGNMMQIIVLAVLLGSIIRGLDNRVSGLSGLLHELYIIFMNAVEFICIALPVFIFASLTSVLWENGIGIFGRLWKPIVAMFLILLLCNALYLGFVAVKFRVSVPLLIRKIAPAAFVGLTTASSIAAFSKINEDNRKLGVAQRCTDLSLPLGLTLFAGTSAMLFLANMYYLAEIYQTAVSPGWFLIAWIVCTVVALASPPVSGGALICLSLLMSYLNIPSAGLAVAGALALMLDFLNTGAKVAMLHLEIVLQADHLKMLNVAALKKP